MSSNATGNVQASFTLPVDTWIKFTSTTVGRDKLYRLVQYFTKWLAYNLSQSGHDKETVDRLNRLSSALGMGRKLFRFGKPLDFIQTILKSLALKDDVIRICAIGRSASLAGWLTLDAFQWLHAVGAIKLDNIKSLSSVGSRCWLVGLLFAVAADAYRLRNNVQRIGALEKLDSKSAEDSVKKELGTLKKEQTKIMTELLQDLMDCVIPASMLEYISVTPGFVGLVGTITSLIGFQAAWPKS